MLGMQKNTFEALNVQRLYVGVGWKNTGGGEKGWKGALRRRQGTDLDVWAVGLDEDNNAVSMAWFDDRDPFEDGSLVVSADNTTGKGPGDDEFITADLTRVMGQVNTIVFGVSAFKEGVTFQNISSVTTRIVDQGQGNTELGKFMLPIDSTYNAVVLCKVKRNLDNSRWEFTTVRRMDQARSKQQIINIAKSAGSR